LNGASVGVSWYVPLLLPVVGVFLREKPPGKGELPRGPERFCAV